jgi:hypothetical protein
MDPLDKFKADFARVRGEAYQPGEKPGEKPRPKRKVNGPAQKPAPAQNSLREFGDTLPGDELDDADTDFGATNINAPAAGHSSDKPIGDEPELDNDEAGEQSEPGKVYWHGDVDYRASRPYLVQDCIPEIGHGLIARQWGTFKTFGALELAHCCMSGEPFLGYEIMRRGGVLFVAVEGASEIPIRLQGVIDDRGKIEGLAPFAWKETCPPLIGKNAADEICAIAEPIASELKARFGIPLVLIIIDTIIAGAGYTRDGQDNDAAAGQVVMNTLKAVAKRTDTFVFGIDHFGKAVETGTRGTSAKEGSADVVIAMLGDRSVSGEVTNTRLALRKRRGGPNGEEHAFTARKVDMGPDQFGKPMSTLVLDWDNAQAPQAAAAKSLDKIAPPLAPGAHDNPRRPRPRPPAIRRWPDSQSMQSRSRAPGILSATPGGW